MHKGQDVILSICMSCANKQGAEPVIDGGNMEARAGVCHVCREETFVARAVELNWPRRAGEPGRVYH